MGSWVALQAAGRCHGRHGERRRCWASWRAQLRGRAPSRRRRWTRQATRAQACSVCGATPVGSWPMWALASAGTAARVVEGPCGAVEAAICAALPPQLCAGVDRECVRRCATHRHAATQRRCRARRRPSGRKNRRRRTKRQMRRPMRRRREGEEEREQGQEQDERQAHERGGECGVWSWLRRRRGRRPRHRLRCGTLRIAPPLAAGSGKGAQQTARELKMAVCAAAGGRCGVAVRDRRRYLAVPMHAAQGQRRRGGWPDLCTRAGPAPPPTACRAGLAHIPCSVLCYRGQWRCWMVRGGPQSM